MGPLFYGINIMKKTLIKKTLSDKTVSLTFLCTEADAQELMKSARAQNITIIDAGSEPSIQSEIKKSGNQTEQDILTRLEQIAKSLEKPTKTKSLNERLGDFLNKDK